jgi:exonuclease SbcC
MKGLKRIKEDKVKSRNALKAKLQRTRKLQQMARVISRTRDILHRDVLPQRVAQSNLARMEGDINANLKFFADPFWVETDEALSFIVHKPGEPPQSAERLSTGQRVVLALAFWPTVAALWQHDLGMLALDEPTANLDDGNRKYLAEALAALTAKVRGNRQLLMVTHDSNLRSSFDQVIDL